MKDETIAARYEPVLNCFRDPITLINKNYVYEAANEAYFHSAGPARRDQSDGRRNSTSQRRSRGSEHVTDVALPG